MERIDGAHRARLQTAVGKLMIKKTEANNLERVTVARGVAHDPRLKELVCFAASLYLDVDVDPAGLLDRAVRIIELDSAGKHWHVLLTDDQHRVIHAVHSGLEDLRKYLAYIGVQVAWEFDRTRSKAPAEPASRSKTLTAFYPCYGGYARKKAGP